jgi:hypothetical protein
MFNTRDAQRFADVLEAAIVAERMFMRLQFEADGNTERGKTEIETAQEGRRNAIGLRKAIEKWPTGAPVAT